MRPLASYFALTIASFCVAVLIANSSAQESGDDNLPAGAATRLGNVGRVSSVAYSPDGRLLAAGTWDGTLLLWDAATGKLPRDLRGHKGPIETVAFSADGKRLVSAANGDPGVFLWETATGRLLRRFGDEPFLRPAFSPDGKYVAAIRRGTFHVWDAATGREVWHQGGDRWHECFAFRPGSDIVISLVRKPVRLHGNELYADVNSRTYVNEWPLLTEKNTPIGEFNWDGAQAQSTTLAPGGRMIAYATPWNEGGGFLNEIRLLCLDASRRLPAIEIKGEYVKALCISADSRMLGSAGEPWGYGKKDPPYLIRVWELATGQERCRFNAPDGAKICLAFAPDGRMLASGGIDVTVLLWNLTNQGRDDNPVALTPRELDELWNDLKKENDAAAAYRSIWKLVHAAREAAPFLAAHLHAVPAPHSGYIAELIQKLSEHSFAVRLRASRDLFELGDLVVPALSSALAAKNLTLESRRRMETIVERLVKLSPDGLRNVRAVEALEYMRTRAAVQVLRKLAAGAATARLTTEAREALERLSGSACTQTPRHNQR
jgi:WD40 repeat protein